MATPSWSLFVAGVLVATAALLVLSWASARAFAAGYDPAGTADRPRPLPTGGDLLANVGLTHGLFGLLLVGLVWYTAVPAAAIGLSTVATGQVYAGVGLGAGLYLVSEAATSVADRLGFPADERLRESLAPEGPAEWAVLTLVALPLVAGAEELLFRGLLVGALGAGLEVPLWALVVGSSLLFGVGHGAQGAAGIAVTAALGGLLAGAFVLTGSLVVVVVAHYTVDVLEFVVPVASLE